MTMRARTVAAAALLLLSAAWRDAAAQGALTRGEPLHPSPWVAYSLQLDSRRLEVFIARDDARKPVVVMLPGSGCTPLFVQVPGTGYENTSPYADLIAARLDRFQFVMIEKAGVGVLRFSPGLSRAEMGKMFAAPVCSPEYLANLRLDVRARDVADAIRAVQRESWAGPVLLAGHSEGTHVVAAVAGQHPDLRLKAIALLASAGATPYFAGHVTSGAGVDGVKSIIDTMQMLRSAPDDLMHRGHPARRWKTFWLETTPLDSVRTSLVPIFVAQGARDGATAGADLFAIEAVRQQPSRPLRYVVVQDGDHGFQLPNGQSRLDRLFDDFLQWGLDDRRITSAVTLK